MATRTNRSSSAVADAPTSGAVTEEHPLAEAGQEAGQRAGHLAERAADIGIGNVDRVRTQAADGIEQLASGVRRVSGDLEGEQPAIANIATTAADGAERVASWLRETDTRGLIRGVEDVARRQPLLFVGGAFLLGVAATRFVKAAGGGTSQAATYGGTSYGGTSGSTGQFGGTTGGTYGGAAGLEATGPGSTGGTPDWTATSDQADEALRP